MYNGLIEFVKKCEYDILYYCQFGFRKNHSTSLASIHHINKISSAIDRLETTARVFLDLSIPLTIKSYLASWNVMVFVAWPWIGLKAFFLVANNLFNLILHVRLSRLLNVVSLNCKVPF